MKLKTETPATVDVAPVVKTETLPALPWRWRTASGMDIAPAKMATTHLFYTLRMLWNNHMPRRARVGRVKLYRFSPITHPPAYLGEAIVHISAELERRTDLPHSLWVELGQMRAWFNEEIRDQPEGPVALAQHKLLPAPEET